MCKNNKDWRHGKGTTSDKKGSKKKFLVQKSKEKAYKEYCYESRC